MITEGFDFYLIGLLAIIILFTILGLSLCLLLWRRDKKINQLKAQLGEPLTKLQPGLIYGKCIAPENLVFLIEQDSINPKAYMLTFSPEKLSRSFMVLDDNRIIPWEPIDVSKQEMNDPLDSLEDQEA